MKKLLFTIAMVALAAGAFSQTTTGRERSEEESQPEIDNLSGLKPDDESLNESTNSSVSNSQTETGGATTDNDNNSAIDFNTTPQVEKGTLIQTTTVYPNPATDFITVAGEFESGTISILNILGQTLSTYNIDAKTTVLNISSLNEGIYFISIESGSEKIVKKLKVLY